jgi:excisionase family DNA binding protein
METIQPAVTRRTSTSGPEPLALSPRQTCSLLNIGITHLYELIRNNELDSYLEGRARRITMESIKRRVARLLAAGSATSASPQPRRRGRPRKRLTSEAIT